MEPLPSSHILRSQSPELLEECFHSTWHTFLNLLVEPEGDPDDDFAWNSEDSRGQSCCVGDVFASKLISTGQESRTGLS
jgi:hypothetical protein